MDRDEDDISDVLDGMPYVRRLVHHSESDCIFEIKTDLEWQSCAENGCDDVTDIEEFEKMFKEQEAEKSKADNQLPKIRTH